MATSTQKFNTQPSVSLTTTPNRTASSTPLPPPSNNFSVLGYSFVLLDENSFPMQELTLAVAPEEFIQIESSTSNVVLTAGDIFTDSFGPGLTQITLSGTFGQRPTGNSLFGNSTNQPTSSGQYLVFQLRDMLRKYLDKLNPIITQNPKKNIGTTLQFYNPKDNEFWNIEPIGNWFTLNRSKAAPFMYRYKLSFVCTGKASSASLFGLKDPQAFLRNNVINNISSVYDSVANTISSISSYATGVANVLNEVGVGIVTFNSNIFTPIAQLQVAVNSFLSVGSKVINYPVSKMEDTRTAINSIYTEATAKGIEIDPYVDYQIIKLLEGLDSYELYSNYFVKDFIKSDFVNQTTLYDPALSYIDLANVKSVTYYTIKSGDTIEGVALMTLGDSKYWKSIAEFNGLAYPYISDIIPKPDKTLGPGDSIAIPSINAGSIANNLILGSYTPNSKSPVYSLGTDFALDDSGDVVFDKGDIQIISGIPNLQQAMSLKLNVHRGELPAHPHYGMADLRGYRTVELLAAKASSELHDTLISDARVAEIKSPTVSINGDIINYSAEISVKLTNQPIILEGSLNISS